MVEPSLRIIWGEDNILHSRVIQNHLLLQTDMFMVFVIIQCFINFDTYIPLQ